MNSKTMRRRENNETFLLQIIVLSRNAHIYVEESPLNKLRHNM